MTKLRSSPVRLYALWTACLALAAGLLGLGLAVFAVNPDRVSPRLWKGYYTLLMERSADTPRAAARLAAVPGIEAVVSRYTSRVAFNTFAGFSSVSVAELPRRLDPRDPRLDPYLRRVGSLFELRDQRGVWEVFYLRSRLDRLTALLRLRNALAGSRWRLAEADLAGTVLRGLLAAAFAALLLLRVRPRGSAGRLVRYILAAGLLPWVPGVLLGSFPVLLSCCAAATAWSLLLEWLGPRLERRLEGRLRATARRRGRELALAGVPASGLRGPLLPAVAFALAALAALTLGRSGAPLFPAALGALSGLLLPPLLYCALALQASRRAHPLFLAVPILRQLGRRQGGWSTERTLGVLLVGVALLCLPLGLVASALEGGACYAPDRGGAREAIGWTSLERLAMESSPSSPPTLADYVAHRAYQEGLPFGRPYRFPRPGERLTVSRYLRSAGGPEVIRTATVVKQYQDAWLAETLAAAAPGSVPRLFLDQGFTARVVATPPPGEPGAAGRHLGLAAALVALFLASLLFGELFRLTPPGLCVTRSLTLRRNQHPS